jgi:hypothetical protein
MANFLELVAGGPDTVRGLGALLKIRGDDLDTKGREILSRIQAIEAGAPWGTDEYGRHITDFYFHPMEGKPANEVMKSWLTETGAAITQLGEALVAAMGDLQSTELDNLVSLANFHVTGGSRPA